MKNENLKTQVHSKTQPQLKQANVESGSPELNELIAVIRVRGSKETRTPVEETLRTHLHLTRRHNCAIFHFNPTVKGWLQMAKDYITWAPVSQAVVNELLAKRGEGAKTVADALPFRLHPPRGGFRKSTKLPFPRGELGKRTPELMEKLLKSML